MRLVTLGMAALGAVLFTGGTVQAQEAAQSAPATSSGMAAGADRPAVAPATFVYANRPIVTFRTTMLSRTPAERAGAATRFLDRLLEQGTAARVTTSPISEGIVVGLGDRAVFWVLADDVNTLAGENLQQTAAASAAALQRAVDESLELRRPDLLLQAGLLASGATLLYAALLWVLRRIHRSSVRGLNTTTERQLEKLAAGAELVRASRLPEILRRTVDLVSILLGLLVTYSWLTFVLRRFPYTRPWGESLRSAMLSTVLSFGERVVAALPDLLTVLLIFVLTRFVVKLSNYAFTTIEDGRIEVPWLSAEVAPPTKRIMAALLWLLGLVAAYPYVPGASTDAFKGISVFVGLMISLGSSGIMNQVMSGFTITYSRALRVGDFVKVGDIEGIVESLGVLSLKIKTNRHESITLPNALVVSAATTNYSRYAERDGVLVSTSVTIGYDTPWRQVEALLLLAADRTASVRKDVPPVVRKTGLHDFYVEYTLLVCPERPNLKLPTLHALHSHILDIFNEYGVQITSPNYEADPEGAKVVPKDQWYAAPATPPAEASASVGAAS